MLSDSRVFLIGSHQVTQLGLALLVNHSPHLELVGREPATAQALDAVRAAAPDVVCIDMPSDRRQAALELCRQLSGSCGVVLCTEDEDDAAVQRATEAGALAAVAKSDDLREVLAAIHSARRGRHYVSPALRVSKAPVPRLSERQRQVLKLFATGMDTSDVAAQLEISSETVKTHMRAVAKRMGVTGRTEAVALGIRWGIID